MDPFHNWGCFRVPCDAIICALDVAQFLGCEKVYQKKKGGGCPLDASLDSSKIQFQNHLCI